MILKTINHSLQQCRSLCTSSSLIKSKILENGVAKIALNNPPVNILTQQVITQLCSTLQIYEDKKITGLVLTSDLPKVFCAGADLNEFHEPNKTRLEKYIDSLQETWLRLYTSTFPTVAVINGHAFAGGCMLVAACEYRIMTKGFKIGLNEASVGIQVPVWLSNGMVDIINKRQTEIACMSGKLFTTQEAFNIGLVDRIVDATKESNYGLDYLQLYNNHDVDTRYAIKMNLRKAHADDLKVNWDKYRTQLVESIYSKQQKIGQFITKIKKK